MMGEYSVLVAFVVLFIAAICLQGTTFLSFNNIINILRNNAVVGIIAIGMTLVIITGGIDLACGAELALIGVIIVQVLNGTQSILLALLSGLAASIAFGLFTGFFVSKFRIPAFIVTLGTMSIYRSIAQFWLNGGGKLTSGDMGKAYTNISNTSLFGVIPMPIIIWAVVVVVVFIFANHIPSGRHIYAVGSNEKASQLAAINTIRIKCIAYTIASVLVMVAAMVETSRLGSINSASSGTGYEMDAIAAAVIGGTSMSGGKGRIGFTVLGTLTLGLINNMMNLLGVNAFLVNAVKGAIIIGAVLLQMVLNKEKD